MAARQRIIPVRRQYNRWVADQTLEDYALRFTAKSARRFSSERISQTAIGAISFLALEAIGGTITMSYGTTNAIAAIVVASLMILLVGLPISRYAIRHGVDIDLLTDITRDIADDETIFEIEGQETIDVPAGEYETWRIRIRGGFGADRTGWVNVEEPHELVRFDFGFLVFR